ncbi:hypothetical protein [Candidatus Nanohalobium constans]|uniref:Uncharacterized protein n=1 Tax=Candidatus Nanohalobium constans TaxID=2565781 RepID=A0A5Q0UER5_9ARCH|nr:hypothetical protein [Candidatus Nanohalobium constans]QGA79974.1 hypothetical protein LC1Nh_0066 [Candidatus Nanohalobium constans]
MGRLDQIVIAVKSSVDTWRTALISLLFTLSFLGLMLISTDVYWHLETLRQGRVLDALLNSYASIKMKGILNFPITIIYAFLGGITLTNTMIQFRNVGVRKESLSILPGFLAAGCASCGVGFASIIGLGAATAALPFNGLGIKVGGIILMLYALSSLGNPKTCSIPSS